VDVFFSLFIFWEGYFGMFSYGWLISLGLFLCIDLFSFLALALAGPFTLDSYDMIPRHCENTLQSTPQFYLHYNIIYIYTTLTSPSFWFSCWTVLYLTPSHPHKPNLGQTLVRTDPCLSNSFLSNVTPSNKTRSHLGCFVSSV
jgi:hypothetical protein